MYRSAARRWQEENAQRGRVFHDQELANIAPRRA
jgi:hypothetical protein